MSKLTDDILSNIDIVDIISKYVNLKKSGSNYSGLCPFHNEKTPSFMVSEEKQIYKCFGCGAWWNAINFIMEIEKIDFWDGIKILSKDAWIDISSYQHKKEDFDKKAHFRERIKKLNSYATKYFQTQINDANTAQKYLMEDRKLDQDLINSFQIGYAPNNFFDIVQYLKDKWFSKEEMLESWLIREWNSGDLYSFFRDRIMFPIKDHIWNIVAFAWRYIQEKENSPKYLNISSTVLYDKSKILYWIDLAKKNIKTFWEIIVVEWYMDVIALHKLWKWVWVATCGTALTVEHIKLLKRHTDNIIFCFDDDQAWISATIRWLKNAWIQWVYPKIMILPEWYKDIDDFVKNSKKLEYQQVDWFEHICKHLKKQYDIQSPVWRKNFINDIFDLLEALEDYSILSFYLEKVSSYLSINYDILFRQFKSFLKSSKKNSTNKKNNNDFDNEEDKKYLLASIFYNSFLERNELNTNQIKNHIKVFDDILEYFPESIIYKVKYNISEEHKQKILEHQLWREKQFEQLTNEKKERILLDFLKRQIQELSKFLYKSNKIQQSKKTEIFENIKNLVKQ